MTQLVRIWFGKCRSRRKRLGLPGGKPKEIRKQLVAFVDDNGDYTQTIFRKIPLT